MKLSFNKYTYAFLLLVLFGILLRTVYIIEFSDSIFFSMPLGPDVEEYSNWATAISTGFLLWGKVQIHAPLYAFFLAFLFKITAYNYFIVRLIQEFIGFAAFIPLYALFAYVVRKYGPDKNNFIFYGTMFLVTFYVPVMFYQGELISEALLLPLLCLLLAALYMAEECYEKNENRNALIYFVLSGILSGLCVLTHPLSLLFIGFEFVYIFWRYTLRLKDFKISVLFLLPVICLIVPVSLYNSILSGKFVLIQENSAFNFYLGNNPNADGSCYLRPGPEWTGIHKQADIACRSKGISTNEYFLKEAFKYIKDNPVDWVLLCGKKALYVWNFRDLPSTVDTYPFRYYTKLQEKFFWLPSVLFLLALPGFLLCLARKEDRGPYRHFIFLLAAFWLAQIIFVTSARYRLPMLPACFAFAIYFMYMLKIYSGLKRGALRLVMLEAAACVIVFLPSVKRDAVKEKAEFLGLKAEILSKEGNGMASLPWFEKALQLNPKWGRMNNLLAGVYIRNGEYAKAEELLRIALKRDEDEPASYVNLGIISSNQGKFAEAEKYFLKAIEIGPEVDDTFYNYGYFLMRCGKNEEARKNLEKAISLNPINRAAFNTLGVLFYVGFKDCVHGSIYFKKALALSPKNAEIMVNVAACALTSGNLDEADYYLRKASAIAPSLASIAELKKELELIRKTGKP